MAVDVLDREDTRITDHATDHDTDSLIHCTCTCQIIRERLIDGKVMTFCGLIMTADDESSVKMPICMVCRDTKRGHLGPFIYFKKKT